MGTTITRRLAMLEARAEPSRPLVVLFCGDGETVEDAWARQRPGAPSPPSNAEVIVVRWMAPEVDDRSVDVRGEAL